MTNVLISSTVMALVVATWNAVAAWRHASRPHDWRIDRAGLPQPANGSQLLVLGVAASISMVVLSLTQAPTNALLAVLCGWSAAFAVMAVRNRRRSHVWFRGRDQAGR